MEALAVIRRILTHLESWHESKGNERGTKPLEEPDSDAPSSYDYSQAGS
jgi:hypothetical protein